MNQINQLINYKGVRAGIMKDAWVITVLSIFSSNIWAANQFLIFWCSFWLKYVHICKDIFIFLVESTILRICWINNVYKITICARGSQYNVMYNIFFCYMINKLRCSVTLLYSSYVQCSMYMHSCIIIWALQFSGKTTTKTT